MAEDRAKGVHVPLLYHFCRLRLPAVALPLASFTHHLERGYGLYVKKVQKESPGTVATWANYLRDLHTLDWFLACACLDKLPRAWEALFNSRASRTDALLVDALRSRAVRLFPRDSERQDEAVQEFWGFLLAGERDGSVPILARYDGQRPLVPWLIRVFQNKHLSDMRHDKSPQPLLDHDPGGEAYSEGLSMPLDADDRWHEVFRDAARTWFAELNERDVLLLGLRLRYRLSQREVASLLGVHEGNVSRQTTALRDRCLEQIGEVLREQGWTGDDLSGFVLKEMDSVLLDEPRLSADRLAGLLATRGKALPPEG